MPGLDMYKQELIIEALNLRGMGIARCSSGMLRIPGAIPGERLTVERVDCGKTGYLGRIIDIVEASEKRVSTRCGAFPGCPGCQLRHIRYPEQLQFGLERLEKLAGKENLLELLPDRRLPEPYPQQEQYRRRCIVTPIADAGKVIPGMRPLFPDHAPVDLSNCPNHPAELNRMILQISEFLNQDPVMTEAAKGIREIRFELSDDGCHRITVVSVRTDPGHRMMRQALEADFNPANLSLLWLPINSTGCSVEYKMPEILRGNRWITYSTENDECRALPSVWTPVGRYSFQPLFKEIKDNVWGCGSVLEIGCGAGLVTLGLARCVKEITGIDKNRFAIESANTNLEAFGNMKHVTFRTGDAVRGLKKLVAGLRVFDTVIIHGMRSPFGAEIFGLINAVGAHSLILVSPSAGSWIRDIRDAMMHGWRLHRLTAFDQLPHTMQFLICGGLQRDRGVYYDKRKSNVSKPHGGY